jgi:hypothetical protein
MTMVFRDESVAYYSGKYSGSIHPCEGCRDASPCKATLRTSYLWVLQAASRVSHAARVALGTEAGRGPGDPLAQSGHSLDPDGGSRFRSSRNIDRS